MALWMVPGGTNYSAIDSPGGPLLGGTTYSMTEQLHTGFVEQLHTGFVEQAYQ